MINFFLLVPAFSHENINQQNMHYIVIFNIKNDFIQNILNIKDPKYKIFELIS